MVLDGIDHGVEGYPSDGLQLAMCFILSLDYIVQDNTLPIGTIIVTSDLRWYHSMSQLYGSLEDIVQPIPIDYYEPQNTLTRSFSKHEWIALRKLRLRLPQILRDAFPLSPKTRQNPVNLWGIVVHPSIMRRDARISVVLMKFLREKRLNVEEAAALLSATLEWREHVNVEAASKIYYPDFNACYGKDREERPVIGLFDVRNSKCIAIMEQESRLLDFETVDQVIHIHGISTLRDRSHKNCKTLKHYPGLIYQTICLDSSSTINSGYEILKGPGGICPCGRGDASSWLGSMIATYTACCALTETFLTTRLPRGHAGGYQDPDADDHDLDYTLEEILSDSPVVLRDTDNPATRHRSTSAGTTNVSLSGGSASGSPMQICRSLPHSRNPALIASTTGSPMRISPTSPVLVMTSEYGANRDAPQNEAAIASSLPVSTPSTYPINAQREWDDLTSRRLYSDNTPAWPTPHDT
ncbi:hypothetical protein CONPUDRAFT_147469 [Coniophora puteana RWD-64-598 SS2]|uniref:CRAL-TRIO domain-containing protein n=1 Tax=Coniophora puteana (strain RWD-64-598) TaxID=741705 RepID=A0A5M3M7F0_CONPW|nr:uncharacterized protein CONPUDRAFT_147469 [Coniophora puteana RWD-64-598 SS2]EIW74846.1 hypothetical protein CONPUDRAFT_147469 [Coniophora puteana RWD-64-598 SS2]